MTVEVGVVVGKVSAFDMDALDSRIRELVAYARERDGEDRTTLFRSLVDMFLTGKAPVRQPTRGQLLDVVEALIPHVEPESRRTVAEILANMSKPPMDLVRRLARDRARLVEDLLTKAPFDEDEIIELIGETGREHHQILAARSDLSANVWIALARAAPSAPPLETRSTLALWRDDLGTQKAVQDTEEDDTLGGALAGGQAVDEIMPAKRLAAGGGGGSVMAGGPMGFGATVTRLHADTQMNGEPPRAPGIPADEKKTASLRILRTDEDLIAERMSERQIPADTKMVTAQSAANTDMHAASEISANPETDTEDDAPRFLRDPGPGGWAWRSDRDGFVTLVSPFAGKLFGGSDRLVGTAMMDMLGLNTKLDHPVSRAFQRRSTIHDAPIALNSLDSQHQYWTLEAAPVFAGGIFEGYEGILTPVKPVRADDWLPNPDTCDTPLFLDDMDAEGRTAASSADSVALSDQLAKRLHEIEALSGTAEPGAKATNPLADMINSTAAAMVREAVADALRKPMSPQEEADRYGPAEQEAVAPEAKPAVPGAQNGDALSTLALLEEALARLSDACMKGATSQARLQAEIAMACARTLKGQLSGDN